MLDFSPDTNHTLKYINYLIAILLETLRNYQSKIIVNQHFTRYELSR